MLHIEELHTYYGHGHILQGVNLGTCRRATLQRSGARSIGKTTLMRSIIGLAPPAVGAFCSTEKTLRARSPHLVARRGVGYVPEGRMIFPDLTVVENIQVAERIPAKYWPLDQLSFPFSVISGPPEQFRITVIGWRAANAGDCPSSRYRSKTNFVG